VSLRTSATDSAGDAAVITTIRSFALERLSGQASAVGHLSGQASAS
jgi:hypothetical protein